MRVVEPGRARADAPVVLSRQAAAGWRVPLPIWALLALLPGLALALVLGAVVEQRPHGGTLGSWLLAEVHREQRLTQSFVVEHDRLAGVQLSLYTSGLQRDKVDEPVIVRLRTTLRPSPPLAEAQLPLGALNPRGPTAFFFEPMPFSPVFPADVLSTTLYLEVEAPTLAAGSGLMIAGTSNNYHDGVLRVGERRLTRYDMAFTPIYTPLLGDRLLPLSRLAMGKPGLLGWPPFYVLLLYLHLLALGVALRALLRRMH
jgi:hypothetical protein